MSAFRLIAIFLGDIALRGDPLALVNWLAGALLIAVPMLIAAYLVFGALVELLGGSMWTPGRGRWREG